MTDKRQCDACGKKPYSNAIGGAMLCRLCADAVRQEIDAVRASGKQPNAIGIARAMYREKLDTGNLLIKDIPEEIILKLKLQAVKSGKTIREIFIEQFK